MKDVKGNEVDRHKGLGPPASVTAGEGKARNLGKRKRKRLDSVLVCSWRESEGEILGGCRGL